MDFSGVAMPGVLSNLRLELAARDESAGVAVRGAGEMLGLIREGRVSTRAELVAHTGLARSTVAQRVDALLAQGYLRGEDRVASTGGRPATLLALNSGYGCVLAVDVGATAAHLALCDLEAVVLAEQTHAFEAQPSPEEALTWLGERLGELREEAGKTAGELLAVGVGIPAPVDTSTGRPVHPPIMPGWHDFPFADRLEAELGAPVVLDNDVNLMALGEHRLNWEQTDELIFVKVATGIGCGITVGGEIYRGAAGAAGDIGHVRALGGGEVLCSCGRQGCLEAIAGGHALAARLEAAGTRATGARDVATAIRAGKPTAVGLAREAGQEIGEVLASIVNFFNPAAIVFGGEVADAGDDLLAGVREAIYGRSLPLATRNLEILHSSSGHRAGIIGAATVAVDRVLDPSTLDAQLELALRAA
jgi:predicted NBD/HSP70 family sugar kinase